MKDDRPQSTETTLIIDYPTMMTSVHETAKGPISVPFNSNRMDNQQQDVDAEEELMDDSFMYFPIFGDWIRYLITRKYPY